MELCIGLLGVVCVCGIILLVLYKKEKQRNLIERKRSKFLYSSSNKNSYAKARNVFKTLENAGIDPDFLGGQHEQR